MEKTKDIETEISCEGGVRYIVARGKEKSEREISLTVTLSDGEENIRFRQYSHPDGYISFPVKEWDRVKGMLDRLIIRANEIKEE
uniref:Uncharacterized protein n=1 Tax=viral metagenome TaxID=1070528 RepID=A0A6M3JHN1_9ZZZZ